MANASKPDDVSQVTNAVWNMTWLNLLGLLVVIMFTVFSTQSTDASERFRAAAVGLLAAVATCLVGAVLGFVFGIPRALQERSGSAAHVAEIYYLDKHCDAG